MIALADISAMRAWAGGRPIDEYGATVSSAADWSGASSKEIWDAVSGELGLEPSRSDPVHVLVASAEDRPRASWICPHVWNEEIPAGSLIRLAPGICALSPEFCYLQMAGRRSVPEVAAIGMELVGRYGRDKTARGFTDRDPLTSTERLATYLGRSKGLYGACLARRALPWVLPNSRSPMETALALVLTLPPCYGGYGLPRPQLNVRVGRNAEQVMLTQSPWYELDLCWQKRKTSAEYDSYDNHLSIGSLDHDSMKYNSLASMGWKTFSVTRAQMSGVSLDILANQIGRALGVRPRRPSPSRRDWLVSVLTKG